MFMLQMSTRRGSTEVHEFDGMFRGGHARFKVTAVIGHVFRYTNSVMFWMLTTI